jgi:ABC-type polysaccharide/polyol phosphate transport system ATPase subunit
LAITMWIVDNRFMMGHHKFINNFLNYNVDEVTIMVIHQMSWISKTCDNIFITKSNNVFFFILFHIKTLTSTHFVV